jgi:hypothetical protein
MPLAWLGDIASLEARISRLEENPSQSSTSRNGQVQESNSREATQTAHSPECFRSRATIFPRNDTEGVLSRSSPAIGLLAVFSHSEDENSSPIGMHESSAAKIGSHQIDIEGTLDISDENHLFEIYQEKVHCRYPFLRLTDFRDVAKRPSGHWVGYFMNMIFSIGVLLKRRNQFDSARYNHQAFYRVAVTRYLSHVFAQPDRLLHIQAYLLLAMHAIYTPSTERIISIASATMRYCVMGQLHLANAEPEPIDAATKFQIQMRRRVFWSAYALDRAVGTAFDLPFSIPDYQITVRLYANTDDYELNERLEEDLQSAPRITSVSFALHLVYCRQIQSEILNTTLHRDFGKQYDGLSHWRLRVLGKLDRWKSLCHRYADPRSITHTSGEWLNMIYNYSLAMLYQPTKVSVCGPAGDWTVRSCVQACLIFRKFQRETQMTELWLGLVVQFKCGVALLYCFFATPPHLRSAAYEQPDVSEAVRACSIILSILAERWPQARCVRDCFDVLAREIPLFEPASTTQSLGTSRKMRRESSVALLALLGPLENIVVHRNTLRMIKEMGTEEFPRPLEGASQMEATENDATQGADDDSPSWRTSMTGDMFQPLTPYFSHPDMLGLGVEEFDYTTIGFPGEFDPHIPF